ncbi:hypothetical protein GT347_18325 [Xylophilus rhododendri]|uniref:Uncharacterized protein n=1 Tax=Xylophilus rhododendri TaxID=2697032 RepID=A0A857J9V1_9BURK|nr:hypothetical protein [Xylophilus rhododendri]QHI99762.1 hypothetical protein GT347_18325 [Xylophilus rhododendri]
MAFLIRAAGNSDAARHLPPSPAPGADSTGTGAAPSPAASGTGDSPESSGAQAQDFAAARRLPLTPTDVIDVLASLTPDRQDSAEAVLREVKPLLLARGRTLSAQHLKPWVALERPELFAATWPGLAQLRAGLLDACRRDSMLLANSKAFRRMMAECAASHGAELQQFITSHESALIHHLQHHLNGGTLVRTQMSSLMGTRQPCTPRTLAHLIAEHRQAIMACVSYMAGQGFPTMMLEIRALLGSRELRLNPAQLRDLTRVMPELERKGFWLFPKGQAPWRFTRFRANDAVLALFRGQPATGSTTPLRGGFALYLLQQHPAGCSAAECDAALAHFAPELSAPLRRARFESWRKRRLLQTLDGLWFTINPALVCKDMRRRICSRLPRQRGRASQA